MEQSDNRLKKKDRKRKNEKVQVQKLGRRRKGLGSLFHWFGLKDNFLSVLRWWREDRLFCLPAVMLARVTGLTNIARTQWHDCLFVCVDMHATSSSSISSSLSLLLLFLFLS